MDNIASHDFLSSPGPAGQAPVLAWGHPALRVEVPTSPSAVEIAIEAQLRDLANLDVDQLRVHWRKWLRSSPPDLPRPLLMRLLAYRLQARAFGDLDRHTQRYLDRVARQRERDRLAGTRKPKAVPPVPPVLRSRLSPGTLLAREFNGKMHRVTVTADGFAWEGRTHQSLSEVARLITGTRWNGPRFFGLRDVQAYTNPGQPK